MPPTVRAVESLPDRAGRTELPMADESLHVLGIDHVQLAMPAGQEEAARSFYAGVLGLTEVPKPTALATRGGCWFAGPSIRLHLGVEANFRPAGKAHPGLLVADLEAARRRLTHAGFAVTGDDSIGIDRFYVSDPFGNRLELIAARDRGFTTRGAG